MARYFVSSIKSTEIDDQRFFDLALKGPDEPRYIGSLPYENSSRVPRKGEYVQIDMLGRVLSRIITDGGDVIYQASDSNKHATHDPENAARWADVLANNYDA